MKVLVLTTSYPRSADDAAGLFVADAVAHLRAAGAEVAVVSPQDFRHFGIAYGHGIAGNLRARPSRIALLPAFLASCRRAAAAAARDADVVHAHLLAAGAVAVTLKKPCVVQVWGTDLAIARRVPALARRVLARADVVVAASRTLADEARALGARDVRVIPPGVDVPPTVREPETPPHVLFAGRLSREKGILDLLTAARELPLVVVGDGPLRAHVPQALGMLPHRELLRYYERAAVVACPSHREGFGVVCAEAMAYGRPVVASAVGGLLDLVVDGETGLLVPPGDTSAFRRALVRLLEDDELRRRLGEAGRARVATRFSWGAATTATLAAYDGARER